jgi:hypothetical protein
MAIIIFAGLYLGQWPRNAWPDGLVADHKV